METNHILTRLPNSPPGTHRFAHQAMGTIFEILIAHSDGAYAEQAAWAAFGELDRIEQQLSRYIENSDVSRINNLAANQPLRIGFDTYKCLRLSARIYAETNGAFDITIGSLLDCYRSGLAPSKHKLQLARQRTGMRLIELNETRHTVRLHTSQVQIDLGGIGKGYAVDRMAALLCDWSIDAALIHGGRSSVVALGAVPRTRGWVITLTNPSNRKETLARLDLRNRAISGSGLRKGRHIIDPRTAKPVEGKRAAWCCAPTAAITDALSTAFMVMSPAEVERYCARHPDTLAMIVVEAEEGEKQAVRVLRFGNWERLI